LRARERLSLSATKGKPIGDRQEVSREKKIEKREGRKQGRAMKG